MSSERNVDLQVIGKMIPYCTDIIEFTGRISSEQFIKSKQDIYAVSFATLQIGELAKHLTDEFVQKTREIIPWRLVKGMRDFFVHGYEDMNPELIWKTAAEDIPPLLEFCKESLKQYD